MAEKKPDLKSKTITELKTLLTKAHEDWVKLRLDLKVGRLKDVHLVLKKRREIARLKTIIREKELSK